MLALSLETVIILALVTQQISKSIIIQETKLSKTAVDEYVNFVLHRSTGSKNVRPVLQCCCTAMFAFYYPRSVTVLQQISLPQVAKSCVAKSRISFYFLEQLLAKN